MNDAEPFTSLRLPGVKLGPDGKVYSPMKRSSFLGAATAMAVAGIPHLAPAAEVNTVLQTPTGSIYGTLSLPSALKPVPVVLIVPGSGATDRDGNVPQVQSDVYRLLAISLAQRGYASMRYDKRGVGASAKALTSEQDLRFDTYVSDVVGWLEQLRADARFSKLVVAGHSEGSLIGMLAAQRSQIDVFVSLEGSGRPAATILREQLKPKLPPQTYDVVDELLGQLQKGDTVSGVPETDALFRPSLQPYLISWFKYDPAAEFARVKALSTIVQGTADVQVTLGRVVKVAPE